MKLLYWEKLRHYLADYCSVLKMAFRSIGRDNINLLSSGMVYSTLIAIVPCLTFLSAFLSAFGALEPFMAVLAEWIFDTFGFDTGSSLMNALNRYTGSAMSLGVVGLVSFIITGMFLVNKIYSLINHIFRTEPKVGTMKRLMLIVIFLIVFTVLITFTIALSSNLESKLYSVLGHEVENKGIRDLFTSLLQALIVYFVFFVIIKTVPNVKINYSSAFSGATLGTALIYLSSFIFTRIISYTVGYSVIYGSLASILFVLLYLYILWYLVVLVMEVTYIYQFRPDKNTLLGRPQRGEKEIADAIDVMVEVARHFERGEGATSVKELGSIVMPQSHLNGLLASLESASLLIAINSFSFLPSRPANKIRISEIVEAVFSSSLDGEKKTKGSEFASLFKKKGVGEGDLTLKDLI